LGATVYRVFGFGAVSTAITVSPMRSAGRPFAAIASMKSFILPTAPA
jgi:hypothetical protein